MAVMQMNIFILTQYTPVRSSDLESFDAHVILHRLAWVIPSQY